MALIYVLLVTSLLGLLYLAWNYYQGYASKKWPTVQGIIVKSSLVSHAKSEKQKIPYIYYQYELNGKEYYSRRLTMCVAQAMKSEEAEKLLVNYPVDKVVTVHYHPQFQRLSVLETGPQQPVIHFTLALILLLVFTVSVLAILWPDKNLIFELFMSLTK